VRFRHAISCLATLGVLGLTGCGDDSGGGLNPVSPRGDLPTPDEAEQLAEDLAGEQAQDSCAIVEQADVEAAFGGEVSEPTEDVGGCTFEIIGSDVGVDGTVVVRLEFAGALGGEELYDQILNVGYGDQAVDVEGVGDAAFYVDGLGVVTVLAGDQVYSVQGIFFDIGTDATIDPEDVKGRIIDLAETVGGRL
jgi:hypothetical protein